MNNFNLLLHDDGKENFDSFEFILTLEEIIIYADSKESVIDAMKSNIKQLINKLNNIDFDEIIEIDWRRK